MARSPRHQSIPKPKDHLSIAGQGPASQQKRRAHVRFGSFSSDRHSPDARAMSASRQKRRSECLPRYARLYCRTRSQRRYL